MKPIPLPLVVCLCLALILASCSPSGPGPAAWLDRPLDQTHHPLEPLEIMAHASSASGVDSLIFSVNDEVVQQVPTDGGRMEKATFLWEPEEPGVYTIKAAATDSSGIAGSPAESVVYIGVAGETTLPEIAGECQGVEHITLTANPPSIMPGECSLLFWEVLAPPEWPVKVNGENADHAGEMPICLRESSAVELSVETNEGTCSTWEFIDVGEEDFTQEEIPPELNIVFDANPPEIHQDECSTLFWEVTPPEGGETLLDGQPVSPAGEQQVCPRETSFYELIAVRNDVGQSIFLAVNVLGEGQPEEIAQEITLTPAIGVTLTSPPPAQPTATHKPSSGSSGPTSTPQAPPPTNAPAIDTSPPVIKSASVSPNSFVYTSNGTCSPTAFKFSVKVTDSGGIARVVLNWTGSGVRSGPAAMNLSGGKYFRNLGQFNNTGSLSGFTITATDKAGNKSTISPGWHLDVESCGGGS
jgi:hypothetical protein